MKKLKRNLPITEDGQRQAPATPEQAPPERKLMKPLFHYSHDLKTKIKLDNQSGNGLRYDPRIKDTNPARKKYRDQLYKITQRIRGDGVNEEARKSVQIFNTLNLELSLNKFKAEEKMTFKEIAKVNILESLALKFDTRVSLNKADLNLLNKSFLYFRKLVSLALNFDGCYRYLTNNNLKQVLNKIFLLIHLKTLGVKFSNNISLNDEGIRNMAGLMKKWNFLKNLKLSFANCERPRKNALSNLLNSASFMTNLNFFSVDLSACLILRDDDHDISNITVNPLTNLRELEINFSKNRNLGNPGMNKICQNLKKFPQLTHLKLWFNDCSSLMNQTLRLLLNEIRKIETLKKLELKLLRCPNLREVAGGIFLEEVKKIKVEILNIELDEQMVRRKKELSDMVSEMPSLRYYEISCGNFKLSKV